jgi:hypothetical protein
MLNALVGWSLLCLLPARAQEEASPAPPSPYSAEQQAHLARLDRVFAAGDTDGLAHKILGQSDEALATAGLDWEKAKLTGGAGLTIDLLYIRDLWRFGATRGSLKETASLITLYALAVIFSDGAKCADKSATDAVLHRVAESPSFQQTLAFFKQLPKDKQDLFLATALRMEASIGPARGNDEYLCRWGAASVADYQKKHGTKGITDAPGPGGVGRTKVVPIDPAYHPGFLPPEQWRPNQAAARAKLAASVTGAIALATARAR